MNFIESYRPYKQCYHLQVSCAFLDPQARVPGWDPLERAAYWGDLPQARALLSLRVAAKLSPAEETGLRNSRPSGVETMPRARAALLPDPLV